MYIYIYVYRTVDYRYNLHKPYIVLEWMFTSTWGFRPGDSGPHFGAQLAGHCEVAQQLALAQRGRSAALHFSLVLWNKHEGYEDDIVLRSQATECGMSLS